MSTHSSAIAREHTPYINRTTRTNTIVNALKRRAQAVLNDRSIDAQSRAFIRYGLETNDPWLAELVRRADAGEPIIDAIDFSETPPISKDDSSEEKIQALMEVICRSEHESGSKWAALLVLMSTLENATHPKVLANSAKHLAFTRCGELNLNDMVDAQVAILESELLAGNTLAS